MKVMGSAGSDHVGPKGNGLTWSDRAGPNEREGFWQGLIRLAQNVSGGGGWLGLIRLAQSEKVWLGLIRLAQNNNDGFGWV